PESANRWVPSSQAGKASTAACGKAQVQALSPHARPFWLLEPPLALSMAQDNPVYLGRRLRLIQGPERIESGWWHHQGQQQRDYFIAQDAHYARYWVYRQRAALDARWFLHGFFA